MGVYRGVVYYRVTPSRQTNIRGFGFDSVPVSTTGLLIVSAYRYIATTTLPIIAVFLEYLRYFLIDFNQIYRHSSVPKARLRAFFELFSSSGFRARRRRDFFCHVVRTTV